MIHALQKFERELSLDWHLEFDVDCESAWGGMVRITPYPNSSGPDRSTVFYVGGGGGPNEAAEFLYGDTLEFLRGLKLELKTL
jgi:hypothetical protein